MKRWLVAAAFLPGGVSAFAQPAAPEIPFDGDVNFLRLPPDLHLGEVSGVAVNSKGNIFVYTRSDRAAGPAYAATASVLLEFDIRPAAASTASR